MTSALDLHPVIALTQLEGRLQFIGCSADVGDQEG